MITEFAIGSVGRSALIEAIKKVNSNSQIQITSKSNHIRSYQLNQTNTTELIQMVIPINYHWSYLDGGLPAGVINILMPHSVI